MTAAEKCSHWGDLQVLGRHHVSTFARYWLTRLYIALASIANCLVVVIDPLSVPALLIARAGPIGMYFAWLLIGLGVIAIIDVVVNDVLPAPIALEPAKVWRHILLMLIAIGQGGLVFVFWWEATTFRAVMLTYGLAAAMAALVAFLDLFQRHRGKE